MEINTLGRVRKLSESYDIEAPGNNAQLALTQQIELLIAAGVSPYQETTRPGRSVVLHTTTAIAAVVAMPTTAHMYAIYNNEPDGGESFVVDWIAANNIVSTAVVVQAQMLVCVGQVRETAPTDATVANIKMNSLGVRNDVNLTSILNATALPGTTGIAANWLPWGDSVTKPSAVGTPGYGLWKPVEGRIIVAPGRYFAVHVLANVVGETFLAYIAGHMKQLTLG